MALLPITILYEEHLCSVAISSEQTLLQAIAQVPSVDIDAPCGGNGTCGKCKIRIIEGLCTEYSQLEIKSLSLKERNDHIRLACQTKIHPSCSTPLVIEILKKGAKSKVMSSFSPLAAIDQARFRIDHIPIPEGSIEDQRSILTRIQGETSTSSRFLLPQNMRRVQKQMDCSPVVLLYDSNNAIALLSKEEIPVGIAVDIGTTTVVTYLVHLLTGQILDYRAELNKQKRYGADVISRIQASSTRLQDIQKTIIDQLNHMIDDLLSSHAMSTDSVYEMVMVGNTTMIHLLLGIDPSSLANAPFIPVFNQTLSYNTYQVGFSSFPFARIQLPGAVSAYIGSDITSGLYASSILQQDKPVLFLDIGTNGELALWTGSKLYCCSSAAGPAFEGASIVHGTGGIAGAISSLTLEQDQSISWKTIDDLPPIGLCGSAIIDAVALALNLELVDETGAMADVDGRYIIETPYGKAFSITKDMYVTHKDIREVQLAKAAIAGGIKTLLTHANITIEDVEQVLLAGGFGNFISISSGQRIGLLPHIDPQKITSIGNAAGKGAVMTLIDRLSEEHIQQIITTAQYLELSSSPIFMNAYIEEMAFLPPGE